MESLLLCFLSLVLLFCVCMYVFACMQVYVPLAYLVHLQARKEHQIPWEAELQMTVSGHVNAGNGTWLLCESGECS